MVQAYRDLVGKTVLVTGANSGLGKETAAALAARGATVVLGCRNPAAAESTAQDIRARHGGAQVVVGPPLDLESLASVRSFAAAWESSERPLHVLVNNAGANYLGEAYTPEGVARLAQVNYLGPYALTRLLERRLLRSAPSRVVNVSSVMHRFATLSNPRDALFSWGRGGGDYSVSKLGNALFSYELQRRLGRHGVQAAAVDPGGSFTSIYRESRLFGRGPVNWIMQFLYSPPEQGARAIVHACTEHWEPVVSGTSGARRQEAQDSQLRFYARGLFARPPIAWAGGPYSGGVAGRVRKAALGGATLVLSLCDQPLRSLSGGRWMSQTRLVASAPQSYDAELARSLWDLSADTAGLPREPQGLRV